MIRFLSLLLFSSSVFSADLSRYAGAEVYYSYHKISANNLYHMTDMNRFYTPKGELPYTPYYSANGVQHNPLFSIYHGWRVDDVAFEYDIGVLGTMSESKKRNMGTLRKKFASLQCIGYIPVFHLGELFFGGGLSILSLNYDNLDGQINFATQKLAKKVIAGFQFPYNDKMNIRTNFLWHDLKGFKNDQFSIDDHIHFGLGVNYKFD